MPNPWKVTEHAATRLRPATIRKLRSLSLRNIGLMCAALAGRRPTTRVFVVRRGGTVLGWAVAVRDVPECLRDDGPRSRDYYTHYYVRKRFRRRGIGLALLRAVESFLRREDAMAIIYYDNAPDFFAHANNRKLRLIHA